MENLLIVNTKEKIRNLRSHGTVNSEVLRNVVKENLQLYVLNFIYHHKKYSDWIMYGGSALQICHDLDRMSVDLDFEIFDEHSDEYLKKLKKELEKYFADTYNAENLLDIKVVSRGLHLRFKYIAKELGISAMDDEKIHVRIDLNKFPEHLIGIDKVVTERIPINREQLSFVINTYNMSALMASKIAAIIQRGPWGVGSKTYAHKGRDIYDLLWYMEQKIIPDLDYLFAKGEEFKDIKELFNKLTVQMNKVNDQNLRDDLSPLFLDQTYISNWIENWRETYFSLLKDYNIHTIKDLVEVRIHQDFDTDTFFFTYVYDTEESGNISVVYWMNDYWLTDQEGEINTEINEKVISKIPAEVETKIRLNYRIKRYITLFYYKTARYFTKTNRIMIGNSLRTKLIRMTAKNLNRLEQVVLNKSALLSCELEDLFK